MTESLVPNPAEAAQFLLGLREGDVHVFTNEPGFPAHQCPRGRTQTIVEDVERAAQRHLNAYFFPATPNDEWPGATVPGKPQTKDSSYVWCELDPEKGETFEEARTRIFGMSWPADVPLPTFDIDSGGGRQFLWRLKEPVSNDHCEAINRWLISKIPGCDRARVNANSLLRLPGTINWPSQAKLEKNPGRGPQLARLTPNGRATGVYYSSADFGSVESKEKPTAAPRFSEPAQKVELHELRQLPEWVRSLIAHGEDQTGEHTYPSRSEALFAALCQLARYDINDSTALGIITDKRHKISDSVFTDSAGKLRRDWERYARRQIEQAYEEAFDADLAKLNREYAVVQFPKPRVFTFRRDHEMERERVEMLSFDDFKNAHLNRLKEVVQKTEDVLKTKRVPLADWWLRNPKCRKYEYAVFMPGEEVFDALNLWRGFAVQPVPGDVSKYLDFVRDTICSGVQEHFDYLVRWMAHAVQRPNEVGHVAVAIRSGEGYGKTFFAESFGSLFGRHCVKVSQPHHLTGQFNWHLRDCLVLVANEAFFAGDSTHENVLKSLVTDDSIQLTKKGVDSVDGKNRIHLILTSNAEWVVPAGIKPRRFLVLDVAANRVEDTEYFEGLRSWLDNGGRSHLLHYLQTLDLTGFNVRHAPKTKALADQQMRSLKPWESWIGGLLDDGVLPEAGPRYPNRVKARDLFDDAQRRSPKLRDSSDMALANIVKSLGAEKLLSGGKWWVFPPLAELRAAWRKDRPWWPPFLDEHATWGEVKPEAKEDSRELPF
jgi:hypothetical protein